MPELKPTTAAERAPWKLRLAGGGLLEPLEQDRLMADVDRLEKWVCQLDLDVKSLNAEAEVDLRQSTSCYNSLLQAFEDVSYDYNELHAIVESLPMTADSVILSSAMAVWIIPMAMREVSCFKWTPFDNRSGPDRENKLLKRIVGGNIVGCPTPIGGGRYVDIVTADGIFHVALPYVFLSRDAAGTAVLEMTHADN